MKLFWINLDGFEMISLRKITISNGIFNGFKLQVSSRMDLNKLNDVLMFDYWLK